MEKGGGESEWQRMCACACARYDVHKSEALQSCEWRCVLGYMYLKKHHSHISSGFVHVGSNDHGFDQRRCQDPRGVGGMRQTQSS